MGFPERGGNEARHRGFSPRPRDADAEANPARTPFERALFQKKIEDSEENQSGNGGQFFYPGPPLWWKGWKTTPFKSNQVFYYKGIPENGK